MDITMLIVFLWLVLCTTPACFSTFFRSTIVCTPVENSQIFWYTSVCWIQEFFFLLWCSSFEYIKLLGWLSMCIQCLHCVYNLFSMYWVKLKCWRIIVYLLQLYWILNHTWYVFVCVCVCVCVCVFTILHVYSVFVSDINIWQCGLRYPNTCVLVLYTKEMAAILSHPRVYSFLHVPVQSGSDAVLADMKREYSVDDFCAVADYLQTQ